MATLNFFRKNDGLETLEWVGIAAVMVLAALAISAYIMPGTEGAGATVRTGLKSVDASNPPGSGLSFGAMPASRSRL